MRVGISVGLSARGTQEGLLVRRDEQKEAAERCVNNLVLRYL
jgi:hypothetical protein